MVVKTDIFSRQNFVLPINEIFMHICCDCYKYINGKQDYSAL